MDVERRALLRTALMDFLTGTEHDQWMWGEGLQVYVRKGYHVLDGEARHTLDLANVQVAPRYQRKGYLRDFIMEMEAQKKYDWLFIENVLSGRLARILTKHGWTRVIIGTDDLVPSFYKKLR